MRRRTPAAIVLAIVALMGPGPAFAQPTDQDPLIGDLRRQLEELRSLLAVIESRIDELTAARPGAAATPVAPVEQGQPARPAEGVASSHVGQATSTYRTVSEDAIAAARFDNVPVDPKYRGYFLLPGTQTHLKIGGFLKTDFMYDFEPTASPDQFIPSAILIPAVDGVRNANVSMRPTRLSVDFLVPSRIGDARFYLEGDFFGTNATTPRLRHAYAQSRNLLVGQTFTNFMDPDAVPDLLDVRGPNGMDNLRSPQVRYGFALDRRTTLHLSVEKPQSDVDVENPEFSSSRPNSPSPDAAVRLRQELHRGHWQFASVFRSIAAFLPDGRRDSVFGWGVSASSTMRSFDRDHLVAQATYGHGISRYIQDQSGRGVDAAVELVPEPHLKAIPAIAAQGAYQHYWVENVRSNLVYGYSHVRNGGIQADSTYRTSHYAAGNLIWNAFGTLDIGAEYLLGWYERKDRQAANASRIQVSLKYGFVRVD
jgi:DcaP outer membrane protein